MGAVDRARNLVASLASSDQGGATVSSSPVIQTFQTGATRSADEHKHDFEGYLSPAVLERFGDYMTQHRVQRNGELRASDNWQKGIPIHKYMKSLLRHTFDLWRAYRGSVVIDKDTEHAMTMLDILMAILFNVQGMAHEMLKRGGNSTYTVCDATREAIEQGRPFSFVPCPPYQSFGPIPIPEPGQVLSWPDPPRVRKGEYRA